MNNITQNIPHNIVRVRETMAEAAARAGRSPDSITLIAVSKTHPAQAVLDALAAGVQHFGENRVEEMERKSPQVAESLAARQGEIVWHMVGHLQSRKVKEAAPLFGVVHSVDTVRLAARLSKAREETGMIEPLDILLEVNVSGEASKAGFAAANWQHDGAVQANLAADVAEIVALPGVRVRGLMTMAPIVDAMENARPVFASLRGLRDWLLETLSPTLPALALPELSMGMTDDYPVAIEEGATMVRVGRAIFGERNAGSG